MFPQLNSPTNTAPDFLAEVVSRTRHATSKRARTADRLVRFLIAGDALVIVLAASCGFWLRFRSPFLAGAGEQFALRDYRSIIFLGCISLLATIASLGVYDRHLLLHLAQSARRVAKAWGFWIAGVLIVDALANFEPSISRGFLAIFSISAVLGLLLWRSIFHRLCGREYFARSLRERVLLIGWNADAKRLVETMHQPGSAYELIGWLPLPRESTTPPAADDVPCLGPYSELVSILRYSLIDIVIFTDHEARREDILDVVSICEREMVQFQLVPSYFRILLTGLHLHSFGGLPLLGISKLPLNKLATRVIKRSIDLVGGTVGLLCAAPIIALFGALVYLESPGPIFYRQRRLGRKGLPFDIIKIRSMRLDAEKPGEVGWSTKVDDRRLRVGGIMRKYNIDELPQFWNVLKGELSLVGPRPERPELIAGFKHEIPHYNARHTVKPGITGWAQVHGLRGDTDLTERIRHDIFYMENWSVGLDLQIMFLTFFKHQNAC